MRDPDRLLSTLSDSDDLERDLLASIQRADPPEHAKAEAWARLSAQIAAVALVTSAPTSAAASTGASSAAAEGAKAAARIGMQNTVAPAAVKLVASKAAIALAVAGVAISGTALWLHSRASAQLGNPAPVAAMHASAPAPVAPPSVDPAPTPAEPTGVVEPEQLPTLDTAAKPSAEQTRRDQLSAESALLTQARADLRKGDARSAQLLLNRMQAQFPKGVLGQEREVLAIEVLAARGNAAAAKRRAQAFIAAYPESPHSAQLSRFADAP